jgi:hypothetical protein
MLKCMGMSIPHKTENSNIFQQNIPEKLLLPILLISVSLLSFAIGRISAFSEFGAEKTDIIITNSQNHNDSN